MISAYQREQPRFDVQRRVLVIEKQNLRKRDKELVGLLPDVAEHPVQIDSGRLQVLGLTNEFLLLQLIRGDLGVEAQQHGLVLLNHLIIPSFEVLIKNLGHVLVVDRSMPFLQNQLD